MSNRITPGSQQLCTIDNCQHFIQAKGLCHTHYAAKKRLDKQGPKVIKKAVNVGPCRISDCDKSAKARGLCRKHYEADCKTNPAVKRIGIRVINRGKLCTRPLCDSPAKTKTLCNMHYTRSLRGIPIDGPARERNLGRGCPVTNCGYPATVKGKCRRHYQRLRSAVSIDAPWRLNYEAGAKCSLSGCEKRPQDNGYCKGHAQTFRLYGASAFDHLERFMTYGCDICGDKTTLTKRGHFLWRIDHDHSCCKGKNTCGNCVRGVLCHSCNLGIGLFKDSVLVMTRAISYLTRGTVEEQRRGA